MLASKKSMCLSVFAVVVCGLPVVDAVAGEFPVRGAIPFSTYDTDGDGLVSEEEFKAAHEKRAEALAAQGRPVRRPYNENYFSQLDTNDDGQLTEDELSGGWQARKERRWGMNAGPDSDSGMGAPAGFGMRRGRDMPSFADYDLNGDGKVLPQEFDEVRAKRLDELEQRYLKKRQQEESFSFSGTDTNGDGELDEAEFSARQGQNPRWKPAAVEAPKAETTEVPATDEGGTQSGMSQ